MCWRVSQQSFLGGMKVSLVAVLRPHGVRTVPSLVPDFPNSDPAHIPGSERSVDWLQGVEWDFPEEQVSI